MQSKTACSILRQAHESQRHADLALLHGQLTIYHCYMSTLHASLDREPEVLMNWFNNTSASLESSATWRA